jgi:methionyl-tRNA formyltransferase
MKLVFLGTPEFGATVLQQLIQAGLKPVLVVTPPDKPAGRKQQLTPCQTKVAAKEHGIPLLEVDDWNKENIQELKKLEPDLFLLASFGKILPKEVLDIPKKVIAKIPWSFPSARDNPPRRGNNRSHDYAYG